MTADKARRAVGFASLAALTVAFSVGGAVTGARNQLSAKLDTTTFALYKARQEQGDSLLGRELQQIRQDLTVLVCDRFPQQPRCLRPSSRPLAPLERPEYRRQAGLRDHRPLAVDRRPDPETVP